MGFDKKVVDEVSGWLRVYDDGSIDRSWAGPPEVEFLVTPVPPSKEFVDGVATHDVIIDPDSNLSVRIYVPEKQPLDDPKLPLILHFHGGGFCVSRADWYMYYQFYARLVKSARAICVSVELRLAPDHRLPAAIDDCYDALLWLRSLARAELHEPWLEAADFSRVFLMGDSSGGNLVHEVAARAGSEEWEPLRLAGGVPIHPGFIRATRSKSELQLPPSPFLTLDMVDKFLALALPLGSTKDHPITCPMGPAAPPLSRLNLPPFLVAVAENDMIRDTEMEYIEAMKKAGKDVEVLLSPGVGHTFYLNKIAVDSDPDTGTQTELLIGAISNFMKRHSGRPSRNSL
ncbi:probable carboxylesterase 15 [Magnolia sinica]|uniref:probable carboxylesterase 15 n=1 Tax=Magnolia sinica TaxID=86752 RepID=UPI0026584C60|nr:probable carboxylesterase 15 [Magnolia sinica]